MYRFDDHNLLTRQSLLLFHSGHTCFVVFPVYYLPQCCMSMGLFSHGVAGYSTLRIVRYSFNIVVAPPAGMLLHAMFHFTLISWALAVCEHWNIWMHGTARNRGAV